jgi:midasin
MVDEHDVVVFALRHITNAQDLFRGWETSHPQLRLIILPLRDWLASQKLHTFRGNQSSNSSDPSSDQVIEALLKAIQSILSVIPTEDQFLIPSRDSFLKDTSSSLIRIGDLLRVDSKVALMNSLIERLAGCPPEEVKTSVSRLLPFVQRYTLLVEEQLLCMARWVNSLFKLQLTGCSVMLNIATNGFCKPPDVEDLGEGGTKDESGVGFGEGEGNECVNQEIEDESQVEGLKDESGDSHERRDEGGENDDDAIEVGDDFQGELESLPESGSEEERPTNEDEEGPEETLGDLDVGDPDAVDEKLWDDEAGPRDDGKQEKTSEDHPSKSSANSEMVAKENETSKDDHLSGEEKCDDRETGDEALAGDNAEEDNGEDAPGDSGAPLDDFVQDSDVLDLPDGLEIDEDKMQQDPVEEVDDKMLGDEPEPATDSTKGDDETQPEPSPETPQPMDETTDGENLEGQHQEGDRAEPGQEDSYPEEDVSMRPDVRTGDGTSHENVPDSYLDSNVRGDPLERPSGSAMGAKAAGASEEARGDEVLVHPSHSAFLLFSSSFDLGIQHFS